MEIKMEIKMSIKKPEIEVVSMYLQKKVVSNLGIFE